MSWPIRCIIIECVITCDSYWIETTWRNKTVIFVLVLTWRLHAHRARFNQKSIHSVCASLLERFKIAISIVMGHNLINNVFRLLLPTGLRRLAPLYAITTCLGVGNEVLNYLPLELYCYHPPLNPLWCRAEWVALLRESQSSDVIKLDQNGLNSVNFLFEIATKCLTSPTAGGSPPDCGFLLSMVDCQSNRSVMCSGRLASYEDINS